MQVVWFKRDLRISDHPALSQAVRKGPVLPLYIVEPELWQQPDMGRRHYDFLHTSLQELDALLRKTGQGLVIKTGPARQVLQTLHDRHNISALYSHQETWNHWTYERDRAVKRWCRDRLIPWHEPAQNGVIRRLQDRNGWSSRWYHQMKQPLLPAPTRLLPVDETSGDLPSPSALGLHEDGCAFPQRGGRSEGVRLLNSFLYERGQGYSKEMSSPVTAFESCSRLSAHLAFGTLSMREVFQATENRAAELKSLPRGTKGKWPGALRSFSGRLRWHCHFMQKLEDEPRIEFFNMHPAYTGLRENDFNESYFQAWQHGKTGYPMIDACMRALTQTGWINFRMRAMLMSFASYHLWLHWREPSLHLARLFTDYEPGIHYSQAQMQSGTTGINTLRIYNPVKQGTDHDPDGIFIRRWIPELADMTQEFIHTPWKAASLMNGYPMPVVDEKDARKAAADKLYALRKNADHKATASMIVRKHGSRKPTRSKAPSGTSSKSGKKKTSPAQQELPL